MTIEGPTFVLAILLIATMGWMLTSRNRARHTYKLAGDHGGSVANGDVQSERKIELLSTENEGLKGQVSRLEERIAVLERIATDPAERTAREIESLR
jgi:hypothetical protein